MQAPKQAVEACPWAVKVDDFDFTTQKSFPVWGFPSLAAAWQFIGVWGRPGAAGDMGASAQEAQAGPVRQVAHWRER